MKTNTKKFLLLPQQIIPGYFTSASYIRLIHPFQRLKDIDDSFEFVVSETYNKKNVDAVIIERIFREDVDTDELNNLLYTFRKSNTKIIYAVDDDFYDYFIDHQPSKKNFRQLSVSCLLARSADAVMCSTEELADILSSFNQNVYVFHNYLSKHLVPDLRCDMGRGGDKRGLDIGYMGTLTHSSDFRIVTNAIKEIMYERDNVTLHFVGVGEPKNLRKIMEPYDVVVHGPPDSKYEPFFRWYTKQIRWDISLAPLSDTSLNRCKSDLKLLDYAAIGSAGVYSNLLPYAHVQDRGLGLVVENTDEAWYAAIMKLINDSDLRADIQAKSHAYLHEHRLLEDNVHKLGEIINSIFT
jgi:glycosyltransferase involved in cell wall biosynthesis